MTTTDNEIEIIDQFETREEAVQETLNGKRKTVDLAKHFLMLRTRGAHIAMGYATWTEYVEKEFERSYRSVKYLIDFALFLQEIEARTGVENAQLTEKGVRGATDEDKGSIIDAANQAIEQGEDPQAAMSAAAASAKAKRTPRTKGDSSSKASSSKRGQSPAASGTDDSELSEDEQDLRDGLAERDKTPTSDDAPKPTPLPVKPSWTFEAWKALTLACKDEHGAVMMRDSFDDIMAALDMELYAGDPLGHRQSA